jgi:hypothetical protein
MSNHVMATVDEQCQRCIVYRRFDTVLLQFLINTENGSFQETNPFQLSDQDTGQELLSSLASNNDASVSMISELYFNYDPFTLRCVKKEKQGKIFLDFDMESGRPSVKEGEKFED